MDQIELRVVASGMVTPVGYRSATSAAALRCRLNDHMDSDYVDRGNQPIACASVLISDLEAGIEKLIVMSVEAIEQCLTKYPNLEVYEIPMILCVAEPDRPGRLAEIDELFFKKLAEGLGSHLHPKSYRVSRGRVGVALALEHARLLIANELEQYVLIVAADTYLNRESILELIDLERLLCSENSNGFIPGEAAAAILVTQREDSLDPQLSISGIGFGKEDATIENEEPFEAAGLTEAIHAAMKDSGYAAFGVEYCISSANGEDYFFEELALAQARGLSDAESLETWIPAESVGEIGAVCGLVMLGWLHEAHLKNYSPGLLGAMLLSNDDGQRAALVISHY
jgi:3-oxoacyl-[acyl-carrier-protein] synthase I